MSEQAAPMYPYLKELTTQDLIRLLAEYVKTSDTIIEADREFIKAIQAELRTRKL